MENIKRDFRDGEGLIPLKPIDLKSIRSFRDMIEAMGQTAFSGRQLGRAYDILVELFTQPDSMVIMTLSGALTVAKQGRIICDLIDRGCVDVIVATGALMTHGLIEGMGVSHFMMDNTDDKTAYEMGYNRVYDTIELEQSFQSVENMIGDHITRLIPALDGVTPPSGSADFCRRIGELCIEKFPQDRSIFASAARAGIPIYIPAFTDCELSMDLCFQSIKHRVGPVAEPFDPAIPLLPYNPFADLIDFARRVYAHTGTLGIFTLGGGVPRNWAQQIAPFFDIMHNHGFPLERRLFSRGVRICPEPVHWGGLSGCTYREGVSWGKFLPEEEGGRYAEVPAEVTSVLPLLIKAVFEKMDEMARQR